MQIRTAQARGPTSITVKTQKMHTAMKNSATANHTGTCEGGGSLAILHSATGTMGATANTEAAFTTS